MLIVVIKVYYVDFNLSIAHKIKWYLIKNGLA